jgi:hypothetical protein
MGSLRASLENGVPNPGMVNFPLEFLSLILSFHQFTRYIAL